VRFSVIGFDLDGTLYPEYRLNVRLLPFLLKDQRLLRAMGRARSVLRKSGLYEGNFYELQAGLMGEFLKEPAEKVKERTERLIYRGWEPHFRNISLFPHVRETLDAFREAGVKMGLLSDFPPETKLENLKIGGYWNAVICSERVGRLKPDPAPFLELARRMEIAPENILYVGNSVSYDVKGARGAGMKTALVRPKWKIHPSPEEAADFTFHDYRQLCDYVLS